MGDVCKCTKEEVERHSLRDLYLKKHPDAFWVDFGDFSFYRMHELRAVNFVGGFARAGSIKPHEYMTAAVDPIQQFAAPVMQHMNEDHATSNIAMVQHYIGLPQVEKAEMVNLDRLGFNVLVRHRHASINTMHAELTQLYSFSITLDCQFPVSILRAIICFRLN